LGNYANEEETSAIPVAVPEEHYSTVTKMIWAFYVQSKLIYLKGRAYVNVASGLSCKISPCLSNV
jgi:hypothetical protein